MRIPLLPRATALVPVLLIAGMGPLLAQDTPDSLGAPELTDIVVTATKVPLAAITTATTVLRGDELRRRGITSLADALRLVPGLAVVQTSSAGTRTSTYTRGGESGYTRVMIDGIPVNDPGGDFDYATVTLDDVDRIEVVRGPSSVLYGTDAVSGVIQVFTRVGRGPARPRAEARAGTFGTRAASASIAGGGATNGGMAGVARTTTNGIHPFNSGFAQTTLNVNLRGARDGVGDLRATVHYVDATVHIPTDGSGALVDRNAFQSTIRVAVGIDAGRRWSDRLETRLILSHHHTDGGLVDLPDGAADTLGFFSQVSDDRVTRRSADARANVRLGGRAMLTGGALIEQQRQRGGIETDSEFGPFSSTTDVERITRAGYAQVLASQGRLTGNLSGRFDSSDEYGTFVTWRAGAAVDLTGVTHLRGAVGRAFREPTFYQNFAQGFVTGNPGLRPEQSLSWEVGLDQRLAAGQVLLRATWFDQRFTDLIEYSFDVEPGTPNYFNIAGARARGLELESAVQLGGRVSADLSYTWLRTKVTAAGFDASPTGYFVDGVALLRRPARSGTARLTWHAAARHDFTVQAIHRGTREDLDFGANRRAVLPASTVIDLSANVVARSGSGHARGMAVTARLSNAFDTEYESVLGFRAPSRALTIGVRLD